MPDNSGGSAVPKTGWFADLMRLFRTDVTTMPDGSTGKSVGDAPVGDDDAGQWSRYQEYMTQTQNRLGLYNTYEQMDMTGLVGSILDMYSEDATPLNPDNERTIWVESNNKKIADECNRMLSEINTEEEITALAREVAKMGDAFERTVYKKGYGIIATHPVPPRLVHRKEDKTHKLLGFVQDGKKFKKKSSTTSFPWDYIHFRIRGRRREGVYGWALLYNMIRPWRQLIMAEDHALMYQINRHPDRNLFLIDVGNMDEYEARKVIKKFRQAARYHPFTDPKNKMYDHRFNPMTPLEDLFLGTRKDSNTRVERLQGSTNANEVVNLTYYVKKLFAAARMPMKAFGFEAGEGEPYNPKVSVTNQDIKYARNVRRLQKALKTGYRTLCQVHLILKMKDPESDADLDFRLPGNGFKVKMAPVSWLEELERMEFEQMRAGVADQLVQMGRDHPSFNSREWVEFILKDYLGLPDDTVRKVLAKKKKAQDREDASFAAMSPEGGAPGQPSKGADQEQGYEAVLANMSAKDRRALDEMIKRYPGFDNLIELGRALWDDSEDDTGSSKHSIMDLPENKEYEDDFEDDDVITEYDRDYVNEPNEDEE